MEVKDTPSSSPPDAMRRGIQYNNFWIEVYPDRIGAAVYPAQRGRYDGFRTFYDSIKLEHHRNTDVTIGTLEDETNSQKEK